MKKTVALATALCAFALPTAASAQKDTGAPENPGCFGSFASEGARAGLAGEFVSGVAQMWKGNDGNSIGEDGTPFLKFIACPGDYRGRDSLGDQP